VTNRYRSIAALVALPFVALALAAAIPVSTDDLAPDPHRSIGFDSALAMFVRRSSWEQGRVVSEGRSILLEHGKRSAVAILLLHGYTNSPAQFDSLGRMLYRDGANVYIPRLPRHAEVNGGVTSLARLTADDLRAAADSAMDIASALGDTVVVVGLSAGGTMATWIAQFRGDASRVIIIAPLLALARIPSVLDAPFLNLAVRLPDFSRSSEPDSEQPDRAAGWNTRAIGQMLRLGVAARRSAERVAPASRRIDILLNANDHTISTAPVLALARSWKNRGADVRVYRLAASLKLPHDVIDPRQRIRRPDVMYPTLIALVNGRAPTLPDVSDVTMSIERE
jgi:esterase/lipase